MSSFDVDSPPDTYKKFRKEILNTIEEAEIDEDEQYPTALFMVDKDGEGDILYVSDFIDEGEFDEETPLQMIIEKVLPNIVRDNNSKYFAFVFPGHKIDDDEQVEIVGILTGSIFSTDMYCAEVFREQEEFAELDQWERDDTETYPSLVIPFRRAITYQG